MSQPLLGAVSTLLVVLGALLVIGLFDAATFNGWVAFVLLCLIPMQVVVVSVWGGNPPFVAELRQPSRGLTLVGATLMAGAVSAPVVLHGVGEGAGPPGPIPSQFAIVAVPITFWLGIMMGGWPFTRLFRSRVAGGVALLAAAYGVTYAIVQVFFDYAWLQGTPVYLASAPGGFFHATSALVFIVTALAVMFLVIGFDLWPFTLAPGLMRQPVLGAVWTAVAIAGAALATGVGVGVVGMDPMVFLTRVTVPFIFGAILVLTMAQDTLFARWRQPGKGLLNAVAAAVIGSLLAQVYGGLAPVVTGALSSGPPGYDYEIWLANALLSVTFPLLVGHAAYFGYWPLVRETPGVITAPDVRVDTSGSGQLSA